MSVPGVYQNPNITPCAGSYTWTPTTPPNIGGLSAIVGFNNLIIDNGRFRNYYVPIIGSPNIQVSTGVGATWIAGDIYSPIINSTRPLNVEVGVKRAKDNNFVVSPAGSSDLIIFDGLNTSFSGNLSTIKFEYDLSLWIGELDLEKYFVDSSGNSTLSNLQRQALHVMQQSGNVDNANLSIFLSNLYPSAIQVIAVNSAGEEFDFPFWEDTGTFENKVVGLKNGLGLTRLRNSQNELGLEFVKESDVSPASGPTFSIKTIKYIDEIRDRNKFKLITKIILRIRPQFRNSSLSFVLKKVMFFAADRVNFNNQLPCDALGYSMFLNGRYYPALGAFGSENAFIWPQDSRRTRPNVHVKLFSPDYKSNSPGFAHSLNVHVIILSFPVFLFLPLFPSLGGILLGMELAGVLSPYFGVIIGPAPFTKQLLFYGTSLVRSKESASSFDRSRTAVLSSVEFKASSGRVILNQDNIPVVEKTIPSYISKINSKRNFYNEYEYLGVGLTTESDYQNQYFDKFGIETKSELYYGSPNRSTQYLQSYDILPSGKITKKTYSFQSYIFLDDSGPNINELFSSEPCLIFKCNFDGSTAMFQEPGLMAATIDCYVTDALGLFDTKLVYRVYAVNKTSLTIDPINNKKSNLKIVYEEGEEDSPRLIMSNFDGTWTFENALVSANIKENLQTISTEIIINSSSDPFSISSEGYDLYCAIYAFSVPNDNAKLYKTENLGALDFPVVRFSIVDNFVLSIPIFYRKSYQNGGDLQAQKDFGYRGEYSPDENKYTLYNVYFNGTGFNNEDPYTGILNTDTGYDELLVLNDDDDPLSESKNIELFISAGSKTEPSVTYVDFVIITDDLSRARINTGEWLTEIVFDNLVPNNLLVKYEVNIVDANKSTLVCKVLSTPYSPLDLEEGVALLSHNVTVPFYIPAGQFVLLYRLYIRNSGEEKTILIDRVTQKTTTIEYFKFGGTTQQTGIRNLLTYYEDLPIQPTRSVGNCRTFFVKFDIPKESFVIYNPIDGMYINGVLYSPTWAVSMPEGMELDYRGVVNSSLLPRASGVQPYQIFFRTGHGNVIKSIDTKKHKSTGLIVTLTNDTTNFSDYAVRQIVSESYARFFRNQNYLQTVKFNDNVVELEIQNPIMASGGEGEEILIEGQIENFDSIHTLAFKLESPGSFANQPQEPQKLLPSDQQGYRRIKLSCCSFVSVDYYDGTTYSAGVTPDGALLYAEDPLVAQNVNTQILLADGVITTGNCFTGVSTGAELTGKVAVRYPGIYVSKQTTVLFYSIESNPSRIYARIINKSVLSSAVVLFDLFEHFKSRGFELTKIPQIGQISVAHNDLFPYDNEFYLAFDCNGKIFFMKGTIQQVSQDHIGISLIDPIMIYGSRLLDDNFTSGLNFLIETDRLTILPFSGEQNTALYSKNLSGSQRVGLVDFDGFYIGVQYLDEEKIMEIVFDKSYLIFAELRQIGTLDLI